MRASHARFKSNVAIGDPEAQIQQSKEQGADASKYQWLQQANRAQGNFCENVPIALILFGALEMTCQGGHNLLLHVLNGTTLLARILHGDFGMLRASAAGPGRPIGHVLQQLTIITAATVLLWLRFGAIIMGKYSEATNKTSTAK